MTAEPRYRVKGGVEQAIDPEDVRARLEKVERESGARHLWVITGMWRIVNPAATGNGQVHLDAENLLDVAGPGCYKCEEVYRPGMERTVCQGFPRAV